MDVTVEIDELIDEKNIEERIIKDFPKVKIEIAKEHRVNLRVDNSELLEVANYLKHDLGFIHPNMCTGIDLKDSIEVLWHIGNPESSILVVLRVDADRENPEVHSLTNIWQGMNWHERETYDMLGVRFTNHPDLRRIIMPENWEGYPLREDYIYKRPRYRKLEDE